MVADKAFGHVSTLKTIACINIGSQIGTCNHATFFISMLDTALRVSEVANIRIANLNLREFI